MNPYYRIRPRPQPLFGNLRQNPCVFTMTSVLLSLHIDLLMVNCSLDCVQRFGYVGKNGKLSSVLFGGGVVPVPELVSCAFKGF
jgi:hypothetical protein